MHTLVADGNEVCIGINTPAGLYILEDLPEILDRDDGETDIESFGVFAEALHKQAARPLGDFAMPSNYEDDGEAEYQHTDKALHASAQMVSDYLRAVDAAVAALYKYILTA